MSDERDSRWLTVKDAARRATVCEKTIRRAYETRQLQYARVGRNIKLKEAWVDAWIEREVVQPIA